MIVWKVVTADTRESYLSAWLGGIYIIQYLKLHGYTKQYFKGTTVEAEPWTMGLFCFTTAQAAYRFMRFNIKSRYKVIKVQGIGRVHVKYMGHCLLPAEWEQKKKRNVPLIKNTIIFRKVKVLT